MTPQPAKFTFTNEFSPQARPELERLRAEIPQAELRGYEAGKNDAGVLASARLANAMEQLATSAQKILCALDQDRAAFEREAIELALATARSLTGQLLAREPAEAITQLAQTCIESLRKSPHVVFRVHPDLVTEVEEKLKKLAFERGLEGRLIVLGDPETTQGNCKIEWADGGFDRDTGAVARKIDEAVTRYMENRLSRNSVSTEK